MIDRDTARKEFEDYVYNTLYCCSNNRVNEIIDKADEYVDQIMQSKLRWIPVNERLPECSYTEKFWLIVKLDDGSIDTVIGTWSAWMDKNDNRFDAFDCWKDTMVNGSILRLSQPIPMSQVIAWMEVPLPKPDIIYRRINND